MVSDRKINKNAEKKFLYYLPNPTKSISSMIHLFKLNYERSCEYEKMKENQRQKNQKRTWCEQILLLYQQHY